MKNDYIMLIERYELRPDLNMHYDTEELKGEN